MAKESMKAREVRRAKLVAKYAEKRAALKKIVNTGDPASNLKKEITKILFDKGYILNYKFVKDGPQGTIKVALKYDAVNKVNAIKKLERVSTPGMRKYTGYKDMPRVINGLGIAIISTSKGVMTDKEAAALKIGGEVLCYVY
jgi:small subunit ribosomal protein S8